MNKIAAADRLKNTIEELEVEQDLAAAQLKRQVDLIKESLKPANLIRNTVKKLISSPKLRGNISGISVGLVAGYFSRKIVAGHSRNVIRKVLGQIIQARITAAVIQHPETTKSVMVGILKFIRPDKK